MFFDLSLLERDSPRIESIEALRLVGDVFFEIDPLKGVTGCERPSGVDDTDVLLAYELVDKMRCFWGGTKNVEQILFVIDGIFEIYPDIIPWLNIFVKDREAGRTRFFHLMKYAHRVTFQ